MRLSTPVVAAVLIFLQFAFDARANLTNCDVALVEIPSPDEIHWIGGIRPDEVLYKNTYLALPTGKNPLKKGAVIYYLSNFESFKSAAESSKEIKVREGKVTTTIAKMPDIEQRIEQNNEYEEALLTHSGLSTNPREVLQFRVLTTNGRADEGKVFQGTRSKVVAGGRNKEINAVMMRARAGGGRVQEIELNHTHPMFQFVEVSNETTPLFKIVPLSGTDLELAIRYSKKYPRVIFTIKAITPSGFYYKASFKNGKTI